MARRAINEPKVQITDEVMAELLGACYMDPLRFVLIMFPWGEDGTQLHDQNGPDKWQETFLIELGRQISDRVQNPDAEHPAIKMAVASGHGVGKSALISWIILWAMSCRQDPAIVVTANTLAQLSKKTWRELSKWHRLMEIRDLFQWTATTFYKKGSQSTWSANAVPWSKERSEGFAGTHARHVLMLFDEASGIDDSVWDVTEGAMTTSGAIWIAFGNPTRNTGRFRECWREQRRSWTTFEVDSRTAKAANQAQIKQWIEEYGEDSDFARIRVRGMFPRAASNQLISEDAVLESQRMFATRFGDVVKKAVALGPGGLRDVMLETNSLAPRILAVDVARQGEDQSVVGMRQGKVFVVLKKYRGVDTTELALYVMEWIREEQPDYVLVDGVGIGAGVVDTLNYHGFEVEEVNAGRKALQERRFFNRRAEMWWEMKEWLKNGGMIDAADKELKQDLIAPEYGFAGRAGEQVAIESKDDMRARNQPSPDTADCLSMTFWMPFAPKRQGATVEEKLVAGARRPSARGSWMSF